MKRAYTNGILLDGTEQMQPVAHKILLTEDDKITAIADEGVDLDGGKIVEEAAPAEFFERPKTERAQRFLRTFTFDAVK